MLLEAREAARPETPVMAQPILHFAKRRGIEPIHPALRFDADEHDARFFEVTQVARHAGTRHVEALRNAAGRQLAGFGQEFHDVQTRWVCEGGKERHSASVTSYLRNVNVAQDLQKIEMKFVKKADDECRLGGVSNVY